MASKRKKETLTFSAGGLYVEDVPLKCETLFSVDSVNAVLSHRDVGKLILVLFKIVCRTARIG